jgi:hypothetical protein
MLRTIIETKDELGRWQPSLPLWFGEPSDPWFFFDSEEVLSKALVELGATVVTESFPDYLEDFNIDATADWFHADLNLLNDPEFGNKFVVLQEMVRITRIWSTREGRKMEDTRIAFYNPLFIDIR